MRTSIRLSSGLGVLAVASLWGANASALLPPCCETSCVYTPAVYTSGAAGDVAVNTVSASPTFGQELVAEVVGQLGGSPYVHTKILVTPPAGVPVGSYFTETFPGPMPPSSDTTGEPHICSRLISPFYLARLSPGAGTYYEDAQPGVLVKAFGTSNCAVSPDGYHLRSVFSDAIVGGSCEKELVDHCAVPVNATLDRTVYSEQQGFNALSAGFTGVFNACMQTIDSYWPWDGVGCGGTGETIACQRAAWQVINETYNNAYPLQYWGLGACNSLNCGYMDGWSDFNVAGAPPNPYGPFPPPNYNVWSGTMLGAGKSNGQIYLTPSASAPTNAPLVPGACDDGGCNNNPVNWLGAPNEPAWAPSNFRVNIPQNIMNAAIRLGKTRVNVSVGSGIVAGYNTCHEYCLPKGVQCG